MLLKPLSPKPKCYLKEFLVTLSHQVCGNEEIQKMVGKVAVIGAGPCGMEVLGHFAKYKRKGREIPEITCFEKGRDWGGMWNYSWRTGKDEFGEHCHAGMYKHLWSNGPKECREFPDYTFEEHFENKISSFPPREVILDYLQGRWNKANVRSYIKFCHVVKNVRYNPMSDDFSIVVKDLKNGIDLNEEIFDYVVVASGHYSYPFKPYFEGIENFAGPVCHAHDFRDAACMTGKNVLIIGSSYSAEDVMLQLVKFGARSVICSWRTRPMGWNLPSMVEQRPLLVRVDGKVAHFKDGTSAEVDAIILCTGYLHEYPFLEENLRLKSANLFYPGGLYKGIVWTEGGNGRLAYVSAQDNLYTFSMFDVQAMWLVKFILGDLRVPGRDQQRQQWREWQEKMKAVENRLAMVDFQTQYVIDIVNDLGEEYPYNLDVSKIFYDHYANKKKNLMTYRDQSYCCKFSGSLNPVHHTAFMEAFDDSKKTYLGQNYDKEE